MVLAVVPALVVLAVLRTMITMVGVLWTPPGGSRRLDRTRSRTELLAPPSSGGGSGSTGGGGSAPVMLVRGLPAGKEPTPKDTFIMVVLLL
jgi:hypothetical protein